MSNKAIFFLISIFIFALILRFLYFPKDIYFGIDQANGSFAVKEILNGHPKLIGPSTTFTGLRHGVLYYYLYAPFYWISGGDPSWAAAFLRVVNAVGVFLIFIVTTMLFNVYVGLISASLFAVSFEQTQFALYFNHPSLAVISILLMYLGLSLLIFRKKNYGLIIALVGLGLSIQFEFLLTYLFISLILILVFFRKSIPRINYKTLAITLSAFFLSIFTFIMAEIKFSFRSTQLLPQLLFSGYTNRSLYRIVTTFLFEMGQVIKFNITGINELKLAMGLILFVTFLLLLLSKAKRQIFFLGIWFFSVIIIYFVTGGEKLDVDIIQYHPNVGVSISLIIFVSYLLFVIGKKSHWLITLLLIIFISFANLSLIQKINPKGSMSEINAQSFMLLSDEKKVLDFIYKDAAGKPFAVKGITLPFYINSTWSYLFEWYGKQRYGYLPIWGGKNASGYPGNLEVQEAQSKLPDKRYLIIEPSRGIPIYLISDYLKEEDYFTKVVEEKKIGEFTIQKREKI